jgi:hypothetical protein
VPTLLLLLMMLQSSARMLNAMGGERTAVTVEWLH